MNIINTNKFQNQRKISRIKKLEKLFSFKFVKETKRGHIREYYLQCNAHNHSYVKNARSQYFYCPKCSLKGTSFSEEVIRGYFEAYSGLKFHKKIIFDKNVKFELDGFNPELKIAFEHDGCQHYDFKAFQKLTKKGKKEFSKLKARDAYKNKYCELNGIKLIRFKQLHKYSSIEDVEKICKELFKKKKNKILNINLKTKYYNEIKSILKKYKCKLVNDKGYLGSNDRVVYECEKKHTHETSASKIKHQFKGCPSCNEEKRKLEQIKKMKKVEKTLNIKFSSYSIRNRESYIKATCQNCKRKIDKPLKRYFDNFTANKKACNCTNRSTPDKEQVFIKSFNNYLKIKKKKKKTKKDEIYLFKFKNKNKSVIIKLKSFLEKDVYNKIYKEIFD